MPDDYGRLVAAIEGEDPSPDFVSSLRAELTAELADEQSDDLDDAVVVELDQLDAAPPTGRQTVERKWLVVGGAAAAVVLLIAVVAGIAFASDDDSDSDSEVAAGGSVAGVPVVEDYFEALAAGDAEAAVGFLASDVTINQTWIDIAGTSPGLPTENAPEVFQATQTWLIAQGTEFAQPSCSVTEEGAEATTVSCQWEVYNGIAQAVAAGPLPVVSTLVITEDGISDVRRDHGPPSYNRVWTPFGEWMDATHPEVDWFFDEESVEASRENGITAAEYATEWAGALDANGCSYLDDPCTAEVGIGRAFVGALDSWDGAAAGALLADDAAIDFFGSTPEEIAALGDWYRATGLRMTVLDCNQLGDETGRVRCRYDFENAWSNALGVGPFGSSSFHFTIEDGQITELTNSFAVNRFSPEAFEVFGAWLEETHPSDLDTIYDFNDGGGGSPILTPEALVLWEEYTQEFVESLAE